MLFVADWMKSMENINEVLSPTKERTAVLVTNQFQCERLIKAGRVVADITRTDLLVLNVQGNEYPPNPQAMQHLFNISSQNNALMNVIYSDNPYKTIVRYIKNNKTINVITGKPSAENSIAHEIWRKFNHIKFFTVAEDGSLEEVINKNLEEEFKKSDMKPASI